jgi:hypothetical protein
MKKNALFPLLALLWGLLAMAQKPTITNFNPKRGGVGTTITITGTNFNATPASNIIWFGTVKSPVLTATATTITVKVPAGAAYERISVTSGGLTAWTRENFLPTFAGTGTIDNNTLAENIDFPLGNFYGMQLELVDIDGDGKPDVATSSERTISFFRNTSTPGVIDSSSMATRYDLNLNIDYDLNNGPFSTSYSSEIINFKFSDIDNDGKKDLLCLYYKKGIENSTTYLQVDLAIYKNQSVSGSINSSSFDTAVVTSIKKINEFSDTCPLSFLRGDFEKGDLNADGKEDLIITFSYTTTRCENLDYTHFLQNNYTGSITTSTYSQKTGFGSGGSGRGRSYLSVTNINTDSKPEIIANSTIIQNISSTGGALTFSSGFSFIWSPPSSTQLYDPYFVDFDLDGKNDYYYNSVIRQNNVNGPVIDNSTFGAQFDLSGGASYYNLSTFLDVNGDGSIDICREEYATIGLTPNIHTSGVLAKTSFGAKTIFVTYGGVPMKLNCQDIDLDGKSDIIFCNTGKFLSIMRNQTPSTGAIITLGTLSAGMGSNAIVPITAKTLNGVEGFQFTISYDPAKLRYVNCSNWAAGIDAANVLITDNPSTGKLSFIYNDLAFSIANGTFFNINFNVIASLAGSTPITWSDSPTPREFINSIPNILNVTYNNGTVNIVNTLYSVSGTISYDNGTNTAMGATTVNLLDNNNNVIATTTTSGTGQYTFTGLANANYTVRPVTIKPWGGATSLDITLYKKHIGNVPGFALTGIKLGSGDVNLSTTLTSIDLTLIKKRIGAQISSFTSGDWLFESGEITINGASLIKNIKAICYGDVNGSNIPQ